MLESKTKLYYSIKEVSELTALKPYVLRYWESEFPSLKPSKNKAGNRTYRERDINVILQIKALLYSKKFTIKGAIEEMKGGSKSQHLGASISDGDISVLKEIRNELKNILNELNRH
ncbi:MAG: MerR family transcriptional regulator [Candidatus Marinimicrobia bacterium]|jgi:DNA-binding transcriptional MerR regulator|nr:MerR family transcriptional regulator [Paracoccaceae bacterium]MBL6911965.1 MerR family transcriptional regulator [Candidatus Neomarinimicrobiota bacterium]MBT3944303.1 MerR family transcriptional regulator [Candidatus Neomarinimicrobiota bacterium]MBT4317216.1 MerR family transcriptional regulator [Candidatus Neomarinimicrobiota bacterium]MBT4926378.1 MerR family transcriptional regulator [Candidatus Neomarinimicrobiota bacterium]